MLLLSVLYALSGQLGLYLQGNTQGITSLWPPTGVATFFVYKFGYRVWPGIMAGLFLVAFFVGDPVPYSPFIVFILGIANITEAFLITYILKTSNFSAHFLKQSDLYKILIWGILVVPGSNALFGVGMFYFNDFIPSADLPITFFGWWLGNGMGLLSIFPVMLIWSSQPTSYYQIRKRQTFELITISLLTVYLLLYRNVFHDQELYQLFYSFILIILCSIRYLHHGASLIAFTLTMAILVQNRVVSGNPLELEHVVNQEIFIAVIYITGFYIATVLKGHLEAKRNYFKEKIYAETILNSIYDSVIVTSSEGKIISVNPSTEKLLGKTKIELIDNNITEVCKLELEENKENLNKRLLTSIRTNQSNLPTKGLLLTGKESTYNIELYLSPIQIEHKHLHFAKSHHLYKMSGCALTILNVSQAHQLKEQLNYQASHDHLTSLNNRRYFELELRKSIAQLSTTLESHVLLFIDLDRFKIINDTSGHIAGDQALQNVASIMSKSLRQNDIVARTGGDEFAILINNCNESTGLEIAEKIRKNIDESKFIWEENQFSISASIGLVVLDDSKQSVENALKAADIACYEAKDAGKNLVFTYQGSESSTREKDMRTLSRIFSAIDNQQFKLFVQPIVNCQSLSTSHYEVLLRLQLEDGSVIPPSEFIPVAERHGVMPGVDKWVVDTAISWLEQNRTKDIKLAINLSGASLGDKKFCDYLKKKVEKSKLKKNQLCFEITETSAIKNFEVTQYLIECSKAYGISFALDDFGSGLSSFAYLKNFPVDYLKIDGSFVREMAENPVNKAMVKSIHQVGKVMGIKTVAEFVENKAIISSCQSLGIDYLQGYAIDKPKPISMI